MALVNLDSIEFYQPSFKPRKKRLAALNTSHSSVPTIDENATVRQQRDEWNEVLGKWDPNEIEGITAVSRKEFQGSLNESSKAVENAEAGGKDISDVFTFVAEDALESLDVINQSRLISLDIESQGEPIICIHN